MKEITEYFSKKNILFKDFKEILPKDISSRKKIEIFIGTTIDLKYYAIFIFDSLLQILFIILFDHFILF